MLHDYSAGQSTWIGHKIDPNKPKPPKFCAMRRRTVIVNRVKIISQIISLTFFIDLFCIVVFVTKIFESDVSYNSRTTNNALILWIKDFSIKLFCILIKGVMPVYENYNAIAFKSCIQKFTVHDYSTMTMARALLLLRQLYSNG